MSFLYGPPNCFTVQCHYHMMHLNHQVKEKLTSELPPTNQHWAGQGREVQKYWVGEKVLKSLPRILGVRIRGIQVKTFLPPVNSL